MNPFTEVAADQVRHLGERRLIDSIGAWLGGSGSSPPEGIGDDGAVIAFASNNLTAAKDCLVYGKHIGRDTPPPLAGAKLLKRNLSDFAAMGANPSHALIACMLPPNTRIKWLQAFYRGLAECAENHQVTMCGGDVTSTFSDLAFSLTLLGTSPDNPLTRKSANPGDGIWVTGSLGGSLRGRHLAFEPRLKEGAWLAARKGVSSAIDVSDGLGTDLLNLCPAGCDAILDLAALPISEAALCQAKDTGKSAVEHALTDGEDYELLFTLDPPGEKEFAGAWKEVFKTPVTRIGNLVEGDPKRGTLLLDRKDNQPIKLQGYGHF